MLAGRIDLNFLSFFFFAKLMYLGHYYSRHNLLNLTFWTMINQTKMSTHHDKILRLFFVPLEQSLFSVLKWDNI